MDILQILKPRFDGLILKGFQKGFFNETEDRLLAYTVLSVKDDDYEDLYSLFLSDKGYSSQSKDDEKFKNYNDDGTYSHKGVEQLVKEDIFKHVALKFYGVNYENDWYVMYECSYQEENSILPIAIEIEKQFQYLGFITSVFEPLPEFTDGLDVKRLREMMSTGLGTIEKWQKEEIPWSKVKQPIEQREFVGQPLLVGQLKQEQKSKLNRAFEIYTNEYVFLPFIRQLKIQQPEHFAQTEGLYSEHPALMYPHSKEYVLCIVKAISASHQSRLYYFLYLPNSKQFFEWTKPNVHEVPGHHAEWILEDIKDLSTWGDEFSFHEPSVTMDDPTFWQEHVLKKENGNFIYLNPIDWYK